VELLDSVLLLHIKTLQGGGGVMYPDDPIGGIWGVRPVGSGGRQPEREREMKDGIRAAKRRKPGHDTVTLSSEARRLSQSAGKSRLEESGEDQDTAGRLLEE